MQHLIHSLKYVLFSHHKKGHGIHSPFVFSFVINCLNIPSRSIKISKEIEQIRQELKQNNTRFAYQDLGAAKKKKIHQTISVLAKRSAVTKKYGILLHKIAAYFKAENIIELGSSLGISGMYLASGCRTSKFITIDGCSTVQKLATKNYKRLNINAHTICGDFSDCLPEILNNTSGSKLIYIDGNHAYDPTIKYFNIIKNYSSDILALIIDDIHWSKEMHKAWNILKMHPKVKCSIDLNQMGILFFNQLNNQQHFVIKY